VQEKDLWHIDKESIEWKMLNGWLSPLFKDWLEKTAHQISIDKEALLMAVAETIRNISYRTMLILEQKSVVSVKIPPFIISSNTNGDTVAINVLILKNAPPDIFCNKNNAMEKLGPFCGLVLATQGLQESMRALQDGKRCIGTAQKYSVAYYYLMIQAAFDCFLKNGNQNIDLCEKFEKTVIEETLHYFDHWTNPQIMQEFAEKNRRIFSEVKEYKERIDASQKLEADLGFKSRTEEIFQKLKNQKGLFSPFENFISKTPS